LILTDITLSQAWRIAPSLRPTWNQRPRRMMDDNNVSIVIPSQRPRWMTKDNNVSIVIHEIS
jgi:hypothetical protein